ncbi:MULTISPECIES: PPE family protein [Mycobacteriaceae]|uniref:PPE family protein n=1 Tax=Mycolicibacterium parafortuitum TaxID=39692 RepID=A0ACC6MC63_MYCPF|nr:MULTISPECIES: PPE family protein [Mycobacteriaceae]MDZ5084549.1 PPE family protein [Mycolicibacterium parafortuitum]GFM20432.1 PPE protein [Mycobacterium sp. PO1]GFM24107.1 PPE protein [Mycobacterium sp. PO2]
MAIPPIFIPPIWGAFPPEVNTSRLMAGAGPAPMLQAAAGWEVLAVSLETQADELAASLASLAQMWQGMGSERAITASMPMVVWLRMLALQAQKRALQASAQASSYTTALATTPPLPEIELNHVTHGVLEATNFLGVNTVPIGLNEADYVRMWDQAATVMSAYQAETTANATFEPVAPPQPIVLPGAASAAMSMGMASAAPMAGSAAVRNAAFTHVSGQGKIEEANLKAGRMEQAVNQATNQGRSQGDPGQMMQQAPQMGMQMASQLGSTLGQLPQQMMQGVTQPFQQLTQPLQQVSSMFGQMSGMMGGDRGAQIGMLGATPFSNHPAIGGNGAASGAGLVRAASLPGAGGTAARTPLMSNLVGKELQPTLSPVSVGAGAAAGAAAAGLAPVGGGGMGGGPMGMLGQRGKSGGSRASLNAPAPLEHDLSEDDEDDW